MLTRRALHPNELATRKRYLVFLAFLAVGGVLFIFSATRPYYWIAGILSPTPFFWSFGKRA